MLQPNNSYLASIWISRSCLTFSQSWSSLEFFFSSLFMAPVSLELLRLTNPWFPDSFLAVTPTSDSSAIRTALPSASSQIWQFLTFPLWLCWAKAPVIAGLDDGRTLFLLASLLPSSFPPPLVYSQHSSSQSDPFEICQIMSHLCSVSFIVRDFILAPFTWNTL